MNYQRHRIVHHGILMSAPGFSGEEEVGGGCTGGLCTNLQASWKLDDLTDATGNGNTLTNNNSVTFSTGKIGNAAVFSTASSQYLSIASNAFVNPGDQDFTIAFWVKLTSKSATQMLVAMQSDSSGGGYRIEYSLGLDAFVFVVLDSGSSNAGSVAASTFGSPSTGVWYCIIARYDTTVENKVFISVNDGTNNESTLSAATSSCTAPFRIGARAYTGFEDYADASIDGVNIWFENLSGAKMTAFYNSGTGVEYPYTTP